MFDKKQQAWDDVTEESDRNRYDPKLLPLSADNQRWYLERWQELYGTIVRYISGQIPERERKREWSDNLAKLTSFLILTQHDKSDIKKIVCVRDSDGDTWIRIVFRESGYRHLDSNTASVAHFMHGTTNAGLYGILSGHTILPQLPWGDHNFKGFFCLGFMDTGSSEMNYEEASQVLGRLNDFPKNATDIVITGVSVGQKHKVKSGGAWNAQQHLTQHRRVNTTTLGGRKMCVRCDTAKITGLYAKLNGTVPNWYDIHHPLELGV